MMNAQSVEQILMVCRRTRDRHAKGEPLRRAYRESVREVANRDSVTYQTIGDLCRRRLQLETIDQTYSLLDEWTKGDPAPLMNQIKASSDPITHDSITRFFEEVGGSAKVSVDTAPGRRVEICVSLSEADDRKLRALAELEGASPQEILSDLVGPAVTERIRLRLG